ncbi:hypothetical protein [Endozoicomonas ascidiicola]|uniref:hypothetical protein n=1 Tax=Endozoicomonas ascidiicola TaxID=1698521 RepID=UPI00082AD6AA|nr:hypothetical protein [Endozoicomonas ascidiicola]
MNHTQIAINSIGKNISSLQQISAFISKSRKYHYAVACLSCLAGTGLLLSNIVLGKEMNVIAGLSGAVIAYAFTIYSSIGARSCVQQIEQIKALEKEMDLGKSELKVLESRITKQKLSVRDATTV